MSRNTPSDRQGFTLIELLVVIAVIGLISSVVLASINRARGKARDARRRGDLQQISKALEFYFNDKNAYPLTCPSGAATCAASVLEWWGNCSSYGSHGTSGSNGWVPNLAPQYIPVLPLDPRANGTFGCYLYKSNGTDYKILAYKTTESVCPVPGSDSLYDPQRGGQCTFAIFTPGYQGQ